MLKSKTPLETNKYELLVTISAEDFEKAIASVFTNSSKDITVPGFRKGKAPRALIEKMYGKSVFYDDALQATYPAAYEKAAKDSELEIVSKPELEVLSINENGVEFKAVVWIKPEIELGEYKGLEVERPSTEVTEQEITAEIDRVRERNSRVETVTTPAELGNIAVIDFEGFIDGVPFEGGKGSDFSLTLGSGQFIPGFEEQVVGHSTEEEFDVNVSFPADYHAEQLAGKPTVFKVKIKELKKKELPALDDEFVKDVSEFNSVEEYKNSIRERIETDKKNRADDAVDLAISEKLIALVSGEIPECMFEDATDDAVREFDYRIRAQGANLDTYLKYTGMDFDTFRKNFRTQAESRVKSRLALEKIAKIEAFDVTDEEIEAEYASMAEKYKETVEKIKAMVSVADLRSDLVVTKAVDMVKANAVISGAAAAPAAPKAKKATAKKAESEEAAAGTEGETVKKKTTRKTTKKTEETKAE